MHDTTVPLPLTASNPQSQLLQAGNELERILGERDPADAESLECAQYHLTLFLRYCEIQDNLISDCAAREMLKVRTWQIKRELKHIKAELRAWVRTNDPDNDFYATEQPEPFADVDNNNEMPSYDEVLQERMDRSLGRVDADQAEQEFNAEGGCSREEG